MKMDRCKACRAKINLQKADNGKTYPLDLEPVEFVVDLAGPNRYVTIISGEVLTFRGAPAREEDKDIHIGWIDHRCTCRKRRM